MAPFARAIFGRCRQNGLGPLHLTGKAGIDRIVKEAGFFYHTLVIAAFFYQNLVARLLRKSRQGITELGSSARPG